MTTIRQLPHPFFVLAPMDDVTDTVFRQIIAECAAPDLYFTEFVNVDGLQSEGREGLLKKLRYGERERPIIAQIWGTNTDNYFKTAKELAEMGFDGIDINMGCPDKTVIKNGCCAALINNRELAVEIIKATKEGAGGKIPVSVKTRIGFGEIDLTWPALLLEQKLNMLTIHGRTVKELSAVPAHWDVIGKVRELRDNSSPDTLIVGNGDVKNRSDGEALAIEYGLDGIMIGRGVFDDPYAFSTDSPWPGMDNKARIALYRKHVDLFAKTWRHNERKIHTLNKFCKLYISGFDGAKEIREKLMMCVSAHELQKMLEELALMTRI